MAQDEYRKLDALGMAELVKKKEVSPTELLDCAIEMIAKTQSTINAVACYAPEMGKRKAQQTGSGLFQGVPFLVKELLSYPGLKTTMGSRLFAGNIPQAGSEYTKRIDQSGFVTFGNTTGSEFGLLGSTETFLHGKTKNPWNLEYSAAGSSGGSAAAVASGIVPMAHASDAGGSIRIPSSVCGLFGFKPSAGRSVPSMERTSSFADLISEHCITKTVRDSAAFLSITEQKGPGAAFPPLGFCQKPKKKKLRIGVYTKALMGHEADAEVLEIIRKTGSVCEDLGHEVILTELPNLGGKEISDAFFTIAGAAMDQMVKFMEPILTRTVNEGDLEPFTLSLIRWFQELEDNALGNATNALKAASEKMTAFAGRFDLLLSPTLANPPQKLEFLSPKLDRELLIQRTGLYVGYTPIHNMCGMCAMSVPLFLGKNGMPIGSHFAALPGAEEVLFSLAYQLEAAAPWIGRIPVRYS